MDVRELILFPLNNSGTWVFGGSFLVMTYAHYTEGPEDRGSG